MLNALTIDVEDYYHVAVFASVIQRRDWDKYEGRVERNVNRLMDILKRCLLSRPGLLPLCSAIIS